MATIDIYDKGQVDTLLSAKANTTDLPSAAELVPDYSGASADDVLTIENGAPVWKAASGGGVQVLTYSASGTKVIKDVATWLLANATAGDLIAYMKANWPTWNGRTITNLGLIRIDEISGTALMLNGIIGISLSGTQPSLFKTEYINEGASNGTIAMRELRADQAVLTPKSNPVTTNDDSGGYDGTFGIVLIKLS